MQGNGVSLTRLLRSSKLALIEFFGKAQKWADMSNVTPEFRNKIDLLERNLLHLQELPAGYHKLKGAFLKS